MKACFACIVTLACAGCNATCLRDSDCIGDSVCYQDRCILVVRGDAGPSATAAGGSGGAGLAGAAGSTIMPGGAGGETTAPRWNLDAAADSAPSSATE